MSRLRATLWAGIGLLGLQLGLTTVQACQPTPDRPLMPAAGGALTELGIQFSRVDGDRFLAIYAQLFAELDPSTAVHVVVGDAEDQAMFEAARQRWASPQRTVTYTVADRPITSWMRDRLAVLEGPVLLAPPAPMVGPEARANDWWVPWLVADSGVLPEGAWVRTAPFQFEGGDLIGDAAHVFVAPPLLGRNPDRPADAVLAEIAAETGLQVVYLGADTPVPDHHIGMFLTPLGDGRVAYADPDLGLEILGDRRALVAGDQTADIDLRPERLERFRQVGRELREAGFDAVPIPVLPATERYVFFSYNNALLERRDGTLHVYMPSYGVDDLDRAAAHAWEAAGARVHPIRVDGVFRLGGSVRCLTAPLGRGAGR